MVMLTARDEEPDRVAGFEVGADDYVPKPFSPRELAARIKAILRRAEQRPEDEVLAARDIVLRRGSRDVAVDGEPVELTSKEFDLLTCFLEHPGHRPLARAAARPGLGDGVSGRHADGRHARRAAAAQARRRGGDPHRARGGVQAASRREREPGLEPARTAVRGDRRDRRPLGRDHARARPRAHAPRGPGRDAEGSRAPGGADRRATSGTPSRRSRICPTCVPTWPPSTSAT